MTLEPQTGYREISSAIAAGQENWNPVLGLGFQDSVRSSEAVPPDTGLVFSGKALKAVL